MVAGVPPSGAESCLTGLEDPIVGIRREEAVLNRMQSAVWRLPLHRKGERNWMDGWMDVFCPGFNSRAKHTHTVVQGKKVGRLIRNTYRLQVTFRIMKCELSDRFIVKRLPFRLSMYSFSLTMLLLLSIGHAKKKEMRVSKLCVGVWCVVVSSSARYYNLKNPFFFLGCQLNFIVSFSIVSWRLDIWYSLRCHMCVV